MATVTFKLFSDVEYVALLASYIIYRFRHNAATTAGNSV